MRILIVVVLLIAATLGGMAIVAYSGWYDVSARTPHAAPVAWFLSTTTHNSVEHRAALIDVPELKEESLIQDGVADYDAMCAGCHGAPGKERGAMGKGLNPQPPDLSDAAEHMSAAELFWVTKNGIRMTGMPAWGATHDDDALWPVVAFLTHRLPELDAEGYRNYLAAAESAGHHSVAEPESGEKHDHGSHRH
ncbi:MAG TPA: cytochrome c [Woeseiaceae bacterium]|nr:cytochrome c [Woeseiaceae bacterium]